jgi:threonine/homoserine/homoserine lactone efflux protein
MNTMGAKRGNKSAGAALLAAAIIGFLVYTYAMFGTQYSVIITKFTLVGAVGVMLLVLGWIGYTMLTAPKQDDNSTVAPSSSSTSSSS